MNRIIEKIKKFICKIKNFVTYQSRYIYDNVQLIYKRKDFVSNIITVLLSFIFLLICSLFIQSNEARKHKGIAQKHFETIQMLEDKVNDRDYEESKISLYYEIGAAYLEKDCGECNQENICEYIDYLADIGVIWYPDVIKSCCQIESNFGQSNVAKNYNNLFGMDHPTVRKTLSIKCSGGRFATFKNWKCSVLDRVLWDFATFSKHIPTKEEYYNKIITKYNTKNTDYKNIITRCAEKFI